MSTTASVLSHSRTPVVSHAARMVGPLLMHKDKQSVSLTYLWTAEIHIIKEHTYGPHESWTVMQTGCSVLLQIVNIDKQGKSDHKHKSRKHNSKLAMQCAWITQSQGHIKQTGRSCTINARPPFDILFCYVIGAYLTQLQMIGQLWVHWSHTAWRHFVEELAVQLPLQLQLSVQLLGLASAVFTCTSLHAGLAFASEWIWCRHAGKILVPASLCDIIAP